MEVSKERQRKRSVSIMCVHITSQIIFFKKRQIVKYGKYDPVLTLSDRIIRYQIPMTSVFLYKRCKLLFAALSWVFVLAPSYWHPNVYVFFSPLQGFKYYFIFFICGFISDITSHTRTHCSFECGFFYLWCYTTARTSFLPVLLSCMIVFIWICLLKTRGGSWPVVKKYLHIYNYST